MKTQEKIISFDEVLHLITELKGKGKKIIQSHGIFDIIHPGIVRHIQSAKEEGDILIVTVIRDKDVIKGPGYPLFNENLRAENIASLADVDYVTIVADTIPFECIQILKPDIFAKGNDYKERESDVLKKLVYEEEALKLAGCRIYYTSGTTTSSTNIINQFLDIYPAETREFLDKFKKKYNAIEIIRLIQSLSDLKVLVLGDTIIDEYHYCSGMGKSVKDNLVVNRYLYDETFAGGVIAVANHIAGICQNIHLVTTLGESDSKENFILEKLRPNITHKFFYQKNSPTIVKRRYIEEYLNNKKLFEICYMGDSEIGEEQEKLIIDYLYEHIEKFDLVLVSDFGHGFITDKIRVLIENKAKISVVNVQTNGANMGYNTITKYHNINFACIDEPEARLATQNKYGKIKDIGSHIYKSINAEYLIITQGKHGSIGFKSNGEPNITPAFTSKVIDRLGAGDAFLAFVAPCFARKFPLDLVSFIGNVVGALAVQIVGNRESVEPNKLYEFIYTLLR